MTRRNWRRGWAAVLITAALAACGGGGEPPAVLNVGTDGVSTVEAQVLAERLSTYPVSALSAAEAQSLAYLREEEQLAHDVYAASATRWTQQPVFARITGSEATHAAAVASLLARYQLPDPLAGLPSGRFQTPAFQTLHDALVAASQVSLVEALKVGVQIEELDIHDITVQLAGIDNADILLVYDNLLKGSRNHLRAYMKVLTEQGGAYEPRYLSQEAFDAIVRSPVETGS